MVYGLYYRKSEGGNLDLAGGIIVGQNNATFEPWSLRQHLI